MNQTIKRYFISSLVTFLTGFLISIYPEIDSFSMEALQSGAFWGATFIAARVGVKAVVELVITWLTKPRDFPPSE